MIDISPTSISPFTLTERFDPRAARLMMALAPTVPELNDLTTGHKALCPVSKGTLPQTRLAAFSTQPCVLCSKSRGDLRRWLKHLCKTV
jgi:hypothetical protein